MSFGPAYKPLVVIDCFGCLTVNSLVISVCAASTTEENNSCKHSFKAVVVACVQKHPFLRCFLRFIYW